MHTVPVSSVVVIVFLRLLSAHLEDVFQDGGASSSPSAIVTEVFCLFALSSIVLSIVLLATRLSSTTCAERGFSSSCLTPRARCITGKPCESTCLNYYLSENHKNFQLNSTFYGFGVFDRFFDVIPKIFTSP